MALDVEKLIADQQAARAAAEAQKAEADKINAALKASKRGNKNTLAKVSNQLNYANALSQTIADMEGKLTAYATSIGRGDKLSLGDQKEFDKLLVDYKSADKTYQKTIKDVNTVLAKAPSPTSVEIKSGKAQIAPTTEEVAAGAKPIIKETTKQTPDDFKGLIKNARVDIQKMSGPERLDLANKLASIGKAAPKTQEFTDALVQQYISLVGAAQAYYNSNKEFPTVDGYLAEQQRQIAAVGGLGGTGGGGGAANLPYGQIYDKTAAKAKVNDIVKSVLNRDATKEEIADLSAKIIKAQKDNPYKTVNGRTVGGLNVDQFLTDLVQATPEFATKKQARQDLTAQGIQSTALANGIKLSEAQLKNYSDRVKNGEDIKTIQTQIRNTAGLGQPDTIKKMLADGTDLDTVYDPYRRMMATSLGITPDSITLDDPTLRMAIGPDKEMSLYDYKKAIRQDNRWKYSQEANDEVTNMISQVKRDFGFMG
jgi:hypothetical protein